MKRLLLTLAVTSGIVAQDKPAAKYPWFSVEATYDDHEIVVTVNGETYRKFDKPTNIEPIQPTPLKDGANVVSVTFTARPGKDLSKSKGSSVKLELCSSKTPANEESLTLCNLSTTQGAVECTMRFEMKNLAPGKCKSVERHWYDSNRKKPSEEYEADWDPATGTIDASVHREWSENGRKKHEIRAQNGKTASGQYFKPDGTLGAEIKDGSGWSRQYFANGQVCQETPFRNGIVEGEERDYFESGKLRAVSSYAANQLQGPHRRYDESGMTRVQGAHAAGEKVGAWIRFDEKGKEVARSVFEKGKRVQGEDPFQD